MQDRDIIDLYFARDEQAIRRTDEKYGRFCHRLAMSILSDEQDAEDDIRKRTYDSAEGEILRSEMVTVLLRHYVVYILF